MKVKSEKEVAQLCPTLSDPMDYSLPGSSIHGVFQARVLEWGAIAFSDQTYEEMLNLENQRHKNLNNNGMSFFSHQIIILLSYCQYPFWGNPQRVNLFYTVGEGRK